MAITYKLVKEVESPVENKNSFETIKMVDSEIDAVNFIPKDETNSDYQEYFKWVEEGNEPEPADE